MKSKRILLALACTGALLFGLRGFALPAKSPEVPTQDSNAIANMDRDAITVLKRVGVAAPMELDLDNGVDPIEEAVKNGFIVEATLAQVEAALAAAAATPDLEDDKRALELRHRGSYRFFSPSASGFGPTGTVTK